MKTEKKSNQWVYECEPDNSSRYVLGEIFEDVQNAKVLICIGVNSSTATPEKLDQTLARVKGYAQRNNYGAWYMLNLYPWRATKPKDLPKTFNEEIYKNNIAAIKKLLGEVKKADVWCAWGATIKKRSYLSGMCDSILKLFNGNGYTLMAYGQTKEGHPSHPLVMKRTDKLEPVAKFEKLKPFNLK